jgi:hypothetical protein
MIGTVLTAAILASTLTVRTLSPDDMEMPGVEVTIQAAKPMRGLTDVHGGARFSDIAPGAYRVRAELAGFGIEEQWVCVRDDTTLDLYLFTEYPCDLTVTAGPIDPRTGKPRYPAEYVLRGGPVIIRVEHSGKPLRRATVELVSASGRIVRASSDRKGLAQMPWISNGAYVLRVRKRGFFGQEHQIVTSACGTRDVVSLAKSCDGRE